MPLPPKPKPRGNFDHILTSLHRKRGYDLKVANRSYIGYRGDYRYRIAKKEEAW